MEETQGKLAEATGILFFIIDYKGEPVTKGEQEKIFVKKGRKKIYAAVSVRLRERLQQRKVQLKTVRIFLSCPNGLVHMAIPIVVNNQYIGAIIGGPIRM